MRRNPHTKDPWWETNALRELLWDIRHPREVHKDFRDGLEDCLELVRSWFRKN